MEIADNRVVSIHFTLENDKGELLDASPADTPLVYLHGADGVIPKLQTALAGMTAGDQFDVRIAPDDAFGHREDELVLEVPRSSLSAVPDLTPGMQLQAQDENTGAVRVLTVHAVGDDTVTLDANHPLAGMTLCFQGSVQDVRNASEAEIAQGHPQQSE